MALSFPDEYVAVNKTNNCEHKVNADPFIPEEPMPAKVEMQN